MSVFEEFKKQLLELNYLKSTLYILDWDEQVYMPEKGARIRANTKAYIAGLIHQKFTSKEFSKLLKEVKSLYEAKKLKDKEKVIFREVYREYERERKLPLEFVTELSRLTSEAHHTWAEARKQSNFKHFLPTLKKIIELKKEEANYYGFKESPYDALLETFEPGLTASQLDVIFEPLKQFLIPFLKQISRASLRVKKSKVKINPKIIQGKFPIEQQKPFLELVAKQIGFDYQKGRLDTSTHPFTTQFHPEDVRITTRFDEQTITPALGGTIHEVGHALYEMGIPVENFGSPLGESVSLGIHESQSRIWENQVGKSRHFWKYFYPKLQKQFPKPFKKIKMEEFYKTINMVKPSFIRVEADEVTYNLHIIIRYELERDLIEGKIKAEDLPKLWNQKVKDYLGIEIKNDADGVLQDVHWSGGMFGYFPTYSLGNLYAAQIFMCVKNVIPHLTKEFESGDFSSFGEWLKRNIHMHGKYYSAAELIEHISEEPLNSQYFIDYIKEKYSDIYRLD